MDWYLAGLARKSLISCISSTASSTPATSENFTSGRSSAAFFVLALPNDICELLAFCMELKKNSRMAPMAMMGRNVNRMSMKGDGSCTWYDTLGCAARSSPSESCPTYVEV